MKNFKKTIYYIASCILIVACVSYSYLRKIDINVAYNGILYRLGDSSYSEKIKVSINGNLTKVLFKEDNFQGKIIINNTEMSKLDINFDKLGRGIIYYYDEIYGEYRTYGTLITSNIKENFTICVLEENKEIKGTASWSSRDGLMVSAPAENRVEALKISNELMKSPLEGEYEKEE